MKKGIDYPNWMNEVSVQTMNKGQLLPGENVYQAFERVANSAACRLLIPDMKKYFYEAMEKGWLCPATPVLTNMGTSRGLPISCFGIDVDDNLYDIYDKVTEQAVLTAQGGGVGVGMNRIRGRGAPIKQRGESEGIIPWAHVYDSAIIATSQGNIRRGASSINLNIRHKDIHEFLRMRRPEGDTNRQNLNLHHCVQITDEFMESIANGNKADQDLMIEILKTRFETGEPYIHFIDTTNYDNPAGYKRLDLDVSMTNICSEIVLHTDPTHSFVCCLSSLNLLKYDDWKDYVFDNGMTLPELTAWFLEGVLNEFIEKGKSIKGMENAIRSAVKGRAIGIGVLGWHGFLQSKNIPFVSLMSTSYTHGIFKFIDSESLKASKQMAEIFGVPKWCVDTRHSHRIALAPTVSNSARANTSASIEPYRANAWNYKGAQGVYLMKNPQLETLLKDLGKNTKDVWKSIVVNGGSVQHLEFLSADQKEVYLTFPEIDQVELVRLAGHRQKYIDQAQSVNLCFPANADADYIWDAHFEAWKKGLKTLYYCRSESVIKGDTGSRSFVRKNVDNNEEEDCSFCEG